MLRVEDVGIGYPGRTLVDHLDLEFGAGQVWGVLGRNGSGKSTLLHVLAGLAPPAKGRVLLEGRLLSAWSRRELAAKVGILFQEDTAEFWGTARDYVLMGRHPHARGLFGWNEADERIAAEALDRQHLGALAERAFASLSGGERQRARAAALFAQAPRAFLVDEPLQHLDLPHQVLLLDQLAAQAAAGALVIIVLHDLVLGGRYCDRFLLLHGDGRFEAGRRAEVFDAERLGRLFGFPLEAVDAGGERFLLPRAAAGPHV
jgi:iron complex transport system ATP-binding protein